MMVLTFGNMSSFMLILLWLSAIGKKMSLEIKVKHLYVKDGFIGLPSIYLGNEVSKVTLENGVKAWYFSSSQYV